MRPNKLAEEKKSLLDTYTVPRPYNMSKLLYPPALYELLRNGLTTYAKNKPNDPLLRALFDFSSPEISWQTNMVEEKKGNTHQDQYSPKG